MFVLIILLIVILYFFRDIEKKREIDNLRKTLSVYKDKEIKLKNRNKELEDTYNSRNKELENTYNSRNKELEDTYNSRNKELEDRKKTFEIKEDLSNFELNDTMIKIFNEYNEKKLKLYENYFLYKPNPSYKSAEILKEIKSNYKEIDIENKKLKLLLSEFIKDDEEIKDDYESSFDIEEKAFIYSKKSNLEWQKLNYIEKLDVILKRYIENWKNKLNIGLEFERYCGYLYEKKGYKVKYWGIQKKKADGGIDLVAKKNKKTLYIQCKYWSKYKTIRENSISQLFGSALKMAIDNGETYETFIKKIIKREIVLVFLTKTELSEEAKNFCKKLNIIFMENLEIEENYPRIKLVEGKEKIFYIPTDLQYDNIVFDMTRKKYSRVLTCKEAESAGYRHCYRWTPKK